MRITVPIRIPRGGTLTRALGPLAAAVILGAAAPASAADRYTHANLGAPPGAYITTGVRMNNLGHVAGYSIFYGQGEPSIKPWVWTPEDGFTILPPPPDMLYGRARAMDISDTGIVAGDGGFDSGIAWRYVGGAYETFGAVGGMPIAYLGAVNDAGDVAGTAKDAQLITEDEIFFDIMGGETMHLTPGSAGGRGSDVNNAGQICGYTQGPLSGFEGFLWDEATGFTFLGVAGLAYSFAWDMNDAGAVVGTAQSASGNTVNSWMYAPGAGQQVLPIRGATAVNGGGTVVGTNGCCGPDQPWIWTAGGGGRYLFDLFNYAAVGLSGPSAADVNDAGQILLNAYDSAAGAYRPVILTPVPNGACCLGDGTCLAEISEGDCVAQSGTYRGDGTQCVDCTSTGACCLTSGDCVPFLAEDACTALAGAWQGQDSSCATAGCTFNLPNDDCANALPITLGDTLYSTVGATTDGPTEADPCGGSFSFGFDIWFTYEPEGDGTLTVSTCNQADYDTRLGAYTGTCDHLVYEACSDDEPGCAGFSSLMNVPVTCGETVLLRVGGYSTASGVGTLSLSFSGAACAGCEADQTGPAGEPDGSVDALDFLMLIAQWGSPCAASCEMDITGPAGAPDGNVDALDFLMLIAQWGGGC